LKKHHKERESEYIEIFRNLLHSAQFINGKPVEDFEKEFAEFCGTKFAVGVGSGTEALLFSLLSIGVKHGDIVITVPNTFIATAEAITQAGAQPEFVDVEDGTMCMSFERLTEYLEQKCFFDELTGETINTISGKPVRAVIPVHLYGQMAKLDQISRIAGKYHIAVIEDSCQAHGAQYFSNEEKKIKNAGENGLSAAFSFYPGKNLGACGEAGAVTTNDAQIAQTIKMLRDHGQKTKYYHDVEGFNGRLDTIQAAILLYKLKYLQEWNNIRRKLARTYTDELSKVEGVVTPVVPEGSYPVYHLYVIKARNRDELRKHLLENGIETALHYPVPLHLQKAYKNAGYSKGAFPVSESCANEIVSLPMNRIKLLKKYEGFIHSGINHMLSAGLYNEFSNVILCCKAIYPPCNSDKNKKLMC
jgi:dTDP-4-amino-4,6-dideoxygalactose transaminase